MSNTAHKSSKKNKQGMLNNEQKINIEDNLCHLKNPAPRAVPPSRRHEQ
jgi:hypothetical protein